jgi:cystathionine beta-synthase
VTDKDAALMTREITKKEGIFAGNSAGSAMAGLMQLKDKLTADDIVVVIFHDHGTRYLGKMFNDDWMKSKGFFDKKGLTAKDLVNTNTGGELVTLETSDTIEKALTLMSSLDISQIPVTTDKRIVGSINESKIFEAIVNNSENKTKLILEFMEAAFPFADITTPVDSLAKMITPLNPAVLVRDFKTDKNFIITKHDILKALVL